MRGWLAVLRHPIRVFRTAWWAARVLAGRDDDNPVEPEPTELERQWDDLDARYRERLSAYRARKKAGVPPLNAELQRLRAMRLRLNAIRAQIINEQKEAEDAGHLRVAK